MATTETRQRESTELEEFRARVRKFLEENVPKRGAQPAEESILGPSHEMDSPEERRFVKWGREYGAKLFAADLAGLTVPREYGGQGLTRAHQRVWAEEAAGYQIPVINGLGLGLFIPTVLAHGTEEQKKYWVPAVLRNEKIFCQLFSEPGAGSDLAGVQSKAERHDGEWILNGQKVWTSGAQIADFGGGPFRTDPDMPKHQGLTFFLIDMKHPGVTVRPLRQITGDAQFNEVFFDDVAVPDEMRIGNVGDGWRVSLTMLMNERMSIGGGGGGGPQRRRGGGEGAIVRLARELGVFDDPEVRDQVMNLYVQQRVHGLLGRRMAEEAKGKPPGPEFSMMKFLGTQIGAKISELAVNLAGASGAAWAKSSDEQKTVGERWTQSMLAARAGKIAGGSDEILLNIIGERVLGLPQDPRVDKDVPFRELKVGRVSS